MKKILIIFLSFAPFFSFGQEMSLPYYSTDTEIFEENFCSNKSAIVTGIGNKDASIKAEHSVLASGKWAKIKVSTSGMKILTRSTLAQMGFNDISKVAVYGNGGKALPYANYKSRTDDLAKLPVYRTDNAILFYAQGVDTWSYSSTQGYLCSIHLDDIYTYYYITDSKEPSNAPEIYTSPSYVTNKTNIYDYHEHHELRSINVLKSGRDWYGEELTPTASKRNISFNAPERPTDTQDVRISVRLISRNQNALPYNISFNGETVISGKLEAIPNITSTTSDFGKAIKKTTLVSPMSTSDNDVTISISPSISTDKLWIDYITLTSPARLTMDKKSELAFRNSLTFLNNIGATRFAIAKSNKNIEVWNISDCTNPLKMQQETTADSVFITIANGSLDEFIAFEPKGTFEEPIFVGSVTNQDLHATEPVDYLIIYHKDYKEQAERLANLHRQYSKISVTTADCDQIYNEFSSGKREPAAIRDFIKLVYDKDKTRLRYVLLFGSGSYDNITEGGTNLHNKVPTYQSEESLYQSQSYVTDDFFGWLDDSEGASDTGSRVDVGIGRFTVRSIEEAEAAVSKTETYLTKLDLGDWKSKLVFVADDGDKNEHIGFAEQHASRVESLYTNYEIERIYLESYASTKTSTGITYPLAITQFEESINNGCLVLNYVGHGGHNALSDERIFRQSYISSWTNANKLPFFITATCDFAPFDNLDGAISAGEETFTYRYGGFIGLLTTTRLVFGDSNYRINSKLYDRLLENDENGRPYAIGDAVKYAKQETGSLVNSLKYILIGDPAIVLARNTNMTVVTDSVNGVPYESCTSPLSALSKSTISGSIRDRDGKIVTSFNGQVNVNLYDKKGFLKTTGIVSPVFEYEAYHSKLFNGTVDVKNGVFEVVFQLSKDINFEEGYGRISYFACSNDEKEAIGASNMILVGGINANVEDDTIGPNIKLWIDYPEFKNNGETGSNPILYATISDSSGINTSGLGIGHDISLIINNNRIDAMNLNRYFKYDKDSYTNGSLVYQLSSLDEGKYDIELKVWDNMNNSSSAKISFNSVKSSKIHFGSTELYPSPMVRGKDQLKLRFSHNDGGSALNVTIELFTINGQRLDTKMFTIITANTQTDEIVLTDELPIFAALPRGIYFVQVTVDSATRTGSFCKKLIVSTQ